MLTTALLDCRYALGIALPNAITRTDFLGEIAIRAIILIISNDRLEVQNF
jgi:hypothetical protein